MWMACPHLSATSSLIGTSSRQTGQSVVFRPSGAAASPDFAGSRSPTLELVAEVGTHGAAKYSRGGWVAVDDGQQRYLDAAMRHLLKLGKGEANDADSGLPHLAHIAWNFLAVLDLQQRSAAHGD